MKTLRDKQVSKEREGCSQHNFFFKTENLVSEIDQKGS